MTQIARKQPKEAPRMNARTNAVARQDDTIRSNVAKIEATKKPTALDTMAQRLNVSSTGLMNTLKGTVFKDANDDQFAALIIVANAYGLNPLTKEIYAFPAKGQGIVPLVSIDGWLRIMNEHPQFDGIEFEDIADDDGKLIAVEAVIYRKDRTRPIRVTEYLSECVQNTDPWRKLPARMLRHRATMQCARYAFGFSGITSEGDVEAAGDIRLASDEPAPMRSATVVRDQVEDQSQSEAEEVAHDSETGEVLNEAPTDNQGFTKHPSEEIADELIAKFKRCEMIADYNVASESFNEATNDMPEEIYNAVESARAAAEKRLTSKK
jgi:phage recombination protein Bet